MAVYSNEVLIGTDGWYEWGAAAMSEVMDIAVGGWIDHDETDETAGYIISDYTNFGNMPMMLETVNRGRD
jgi:hypothetical protein